MVRLICLFEYLGFQKRETCCSKPLQDRVHRQDCWTNKRLMTAVPLSVLDSFMIQYTRLVTIADWEVNKIWCRGLNLHLKIRFLSTEFLFDNNHTLEATSLHLF